MKRNVVIESECAVSNLDFPLHLDHAWLFVAAGIHLRLFDRTADNDFVENAVSRIERTGERSYVLVISNAHCWTDGAPVRANEVAMALSRGRQAGIFASVSTRHDDRISVQTTSKAELHTTSGRTRVALRAIASPPQAWSMRLPKRKRTDAPRATSNRLARNASNIAFLNSCADVVARR